MDVYLDTLLHPRLIRQTFEQEGWHFELENLDAPLTYRGVVFNEVKGGYTTADAVLFTETLRALFPDTVYGYHVGGHPRYLPNLTYEELRAFHASYYHPSNARFFLYGDLPLEECLRRVDAYLQEFDRAPATSDIPLQPCFDSPRTVTAPYQPTDDDAVSNNAYVTVNWMLTENDDPARTLALEVLREVLIGSPAAPLCKALLDSGLGDDLAGLSEWLPMAKLRYLDFSTGLKGVAPENVERIEPFILNALEKLAEGGLAQKTLEAALNAVEFRLRENNPGGWIAGQRGFTLMMRALSTWIYDRDPLALIAFEEPLIAVKEKWMADSRYYEALIRTHMLENPHRVTLHLQPDPGLLRREEAEENERLAQARAAMSEAELQAIIENTRKLKQFQETPNSPEVLAALPVLKHSDLEREAPRIPQEILEEAQTRVLYHPLPTNSIVYLDLGFDLRALPQDHLPYAAVFGQILLEMGTQTHDFVQMTQRMGQFTGGIRFEVLASEARGDRSGPVFLFLRGKAMTDRGDELLSILHDLLLSVNLDNRERFRQIVLKEKGRRKADLPGSRQMGYGRLRAHFNEPDWVNDQLTGLGGLFFLRRLAQEVESDWPAVLTRLKAVHATLVNRNAMLANVTLDSSAWPRFRPAFADFLSDLPLAPVEHAQWTRPILAANEGFTTDDSGIVTKDLIF